MTIDTGHAAAAHLQDPSHYASPEAAPPRSLRLAKDALAGVSIAGLLLPEAVAYAGLANLPPQAGVVALLVGLLVYAALGSSRFAIVSATSSSAAVLAATVSAVPGARLAAAAALVAAAGGLFLLAGVARLGGVSDFIAKPVLRGFAFGLALTITLKQISSIVGVKSRFPDAPRIAYDLLVQAPQWNLHSVGVGAVALAILFALGRRARIPATLVVIVLGIGAAIVARVPKVRRMVAPQARKVWNQITHLAKSPGRTLTIVASGLIGGVLYALCLGACLRAYGGHLSLAMLIVINSSASTVANLAPVPGGMGVAEAGLVAGMTAAGIDSSTAVAAVMTHRLITFWLPPFFGWLAIRDLAHRKFI